MNETQDPGRVKSDELARNAARNAIRDMLDGAAGDGAPAGRCGPVADHLTRHHDVTWERDVNSAGMAVRRYVMRGEWTVDPERIRPEDGSLCNHGSGGGPA